VKGLLADIRKSYKSFATTRHSLNTTPEVDGMLQRDPKRVSFVQANFYDVVSCQRAVQGMDGAFLVADNLQELVHSNSTVFSRVGLDRDAPELPKITHICVFGALVSPQGRSDVKGLLADTWKS
jgi:hypothetical protein